MWCAGDAHQSEKIFGRCLLFDLHCVLGYLRPVGLGRQTREAPAFDVRFQTWLEVPTHGRDIVGANANSGLRLAVAGHCSAGLVERPPPGARGDALELLTRHIAKHFMIDLRYESAGARQLSRTAQSLLRDAAFELRR